MSVILDALKKLDRENLFRRSGTPHIATEILRPDLPGPRKRMPRYFIVIALTALATVALTYAVVGYRFVPKSKLPAPANPLASTRPVTETPSPSSSGAPLNSPIPAPVNGPSAVQQAASAPSDSGSRTKPSPPAALNLPAAKEQATSAPVSPEPVRDVRGEVNRVIPKIQSPAESKKTEPSPSVEEEEIDEEADLEEEPPPPTVAKPTKPASLRLSAIVWHDDPSKRIAVINGVLANEGSAVVQGVKVEQIFTDRVRVSQDGRVFDLPLR